MAQNIFNHAKVSGISVVIPKNEIRIEDEIQYFDNNIKKVERIKKMIGIGSRRVADPNVTAADLCQQAAENLMNDMGIERDSINALIFISQGPDHAIPATACILQDKLHLSKQCAAFDVNQGCTAYVYGLWLASSLVESKACQRVLVLVGEAGAYRTAPDNRVLSPIFGDCGSATLVEYNEKEEKSYFILGTDGSGAEALMVPAGHARFPLPSSKEEYETYFRPVIDWGNNPWYLSTTFMDGGAIFSFTLDVVPDHLKNLLEFSHETPETIEWVILHQANKQIAENLAAKLGFPKEKVPTETFTKYGNQSGASLPSVICDQISNEVSQKPTKVLLSGYGVGLSWASAVLILDNIWCSRIREFNTPDNLPTPKELEKYWIEKFKNNLKK